jgi:hypothetical protein
MSTGEDRVIVTPGVTAGLAAAHHRDFPEIRAEGESATDAASQLVHHLTRALDTALTDWRRTAIEQAIAEVKAFAEQAGT